MGFSLFYFSMILIMSVLHLWLVAAGENGRLLGEMFGFRGISDNTGISGSPRTYIRLPLNRRGSKKLFHAEDDYEEDTRRPYKPEENWSNAAYEHPNIYGQRWGIQYGAHQKPVVVIVPDKS